MNKITAIACVFFIGISSLTAQHQITSPNEKIKVNIIDF